MLKNTPSKRFSQLAAAGTLLSLLMILFGILSGNYLPESTAESFIFLSPLPLAFTMIGLHERYGRNWVDTAIFAAGAVGVSTLTLSVIISIWHPFPLFTTTRYALLTTTLISGTAVWILGINIQARRNRFLQTPLALIGIIAGVSWLILVISSVSLWQAYIPTQLLTLNLMIWIPAHITWLMWMTIALLNNGRSGTITPKHQTLTN